MSLLIPDPGLLFWMLISFGLVFFILAKYGFPVILKMVDKRRVFIEESLEGAKEANRQLVGIKSEGEKLINEARTKQMEMIHNTSQMRDQMVKEAKESAQKEAGKVMENARLAIEQERDDALKEVRTQVVTLSVDIAEKLMRRELKEKGAQLELVDKLLEEAKN